MLNFVLCDDNSGASNRLYNILESLFIKHNLDAEIGLSSEKAEDILEYVEKYKVDVFILDINLNSNISGLDLAKQIRETNKNAYFIFTTAHLEFSLIAYSVKTFDYLPKPLTPERVEVTLLRLIDDIYKSPKNFINIDNKTVVDQNDILYIKRDGMKLVFHTKESNHATYSSFLKLENTLPNNFLRCHKSYIVNVDKITNVEINNNIAICEDNMTCPIGPKYKENFMEVLKHGNFTNDMVSSNN